MMGRFDTIPRGARHDRKNFRAPRVAEIVGQAPVEPEQDLAGNIDSKLLGALFVAASVVYLGIYALEAPVRYALYVAGKDNFILLRDGLIIGPLALLIA